MFWHLLPGAVIGTQVFRVSPISTEEWEEKKDFFDEKTERIWPNAELSARAKFTREYVVKQFWTSFVEEKFDLDSNPDNSCVLVCHCSNGQTWRVGRRR